MTTPRSHSYAHPRHDPDEVTAQLAALHACITGQRGDQSEAIEEPEPREPVGDRESAWLENREEQRDERTRWGGAA